MKGERVRRSFRPDVFDRLETHALLTLTADWQLPDVHVVAGSCRFARESGFVLS